MKKTLLLAGLAYAWLGGEMAAVANEPKPAAEAPGGIRMADESAPSSSETSSLATPESGSLDERTRQDRRIRDLALRIADAQPDSWVAQAAARDMDNWRKSPVPKAPAPKLASDVSYGKDFTALFRPSRWRRPLKVGGTLSWLNPRAWRAEPYRTLTVLTGEAVFGLAVYYAADALDRGGSGSGRSDPEPEPTSTPRSSSPAPSDTSPESGGSEGGADDTGAGGGIEDF